jgi:hypothetical protein
MVSIYASGIYKNVYREIAAVTLVACFVVAWNALTGGYVDFEGVKHAGLISSLPVLGLPLATFTLSSPSLGLLLSKYDCHCISL